MWRPGAQTVASDLRRSRAPQNAVSIPRSRNELASRRVAVASLVSVAKLTRYSAYSYDDNHVRSESFSPRIRCSPGHSL
jgi:hypothetical protein